MFCFEEQTPTLLYFIIYFKLRYYQSRLKLPKTFCLTEKNDHGEVVEKTFELCGYICHNGGTPTSGHYTACAKRTKEGKEEWLLFDDHDVKVVTGAQCEFGEKNCYLAAYEHNDGENTFNH